jgi:hypothetical protein
MLLVNANNLGHVATVEKTLGKRHSSNSRRVKPLQYVVQVDISSEPEAQTPNDSGKETEAIFTRSGIYVTTSVDDKTHTNQVLLKVFVRALESTKHFLVLTDAPVKTDTPVKRQGYRVDLHFARKNGSQGVLFAEFYDEKGGLAWFGNTDCHQVPSGKLFDEASQALVADFVSSLNSPNLALNVGYK